ncbi:hypothetical protein CQZ91_05805 [Bacillus cereus]|uniref:hypothetical protein n=1 Tax=Bacillus cereus TaxID=1396 RepID=UPI00099549E0|nr:hypothetical protein [Bacillus cereus]OPA03631.1 hypothetical protein BHL51_02660 [Bacillus cereus]PRC98272.1 hypothetical protein CQZ92_10130 [Bacillus cereus]PRD04853.1 hypothetical protein CQZ91_05805 [Bacillus cereus]
MNLKLKPEIETALKKIDFVNRYTELSSFSRENYDAEEIIPNPNIEEIQQILEKLGYKSVYDKKEKFFKVGELGDKKENLFYFHIGIKVNVLDFTWVVYHNDELRLGSPWSLYSRLLISPDTRIKPVLFSDYDSLEKILKIALGMYEDFKQELIPIYS